MTRRHFLLSAATAGAAVANAPAGWILVHEHVLVDFIDAKDLTGPQHLRYDRDEVVRAALPHLQAIAKLGCVRLQECTPNFLGRDPVLLQRLSREAGLEIWTNTGLYSAREHRHLPDYALRETAQQLADRWITEASNGVDGMEPRFIKIGVNKGPLDDLDRKIVEAAALTSKATGLVICSHTGDGRAALDQYDIIVQRGRVSAKKFVWVHAQNELDLGIHERLARAGCWIEFDAIGKPSAQWHLRCIRHMAGKRLLSRVLISQDAGWYSVGQPGGGNFRGFDYIYTGFRAQLDPGHWETLMWRNPRRCFGS